MPYHHFEPGYRIPDSTLISTGRMERRRFQHVNRNVSIRYWEFQCGCGELFWISTGEIKREPHLKGCRKCRGTGMSLQDRIESYYLKGLPNECWPWTKSVNEHGYGTTRGLIDNRGKSLLSHRIVLEKKLGRSIREGYCALHTCNNPICGNPNHLYEGTHYQNMVDRDNAGHTIRGERQPSSKLRESDVIQIKKALLAGAKNKMLSLQYGVSKSAIYEIKRGRHWKHISILFPEEY